MTLKLVEFRGKESQKNLTHAHTFQSDCANEMNCGAKPNPSEDITVCSNMLLLARTDDKNTKHHGIGVSCWKC